MKFSELKELFATRRSIRKWKPDPVPEELLVQALEAANLSPNSGGKQTYKCYVITNKEKIAAIGQAVQEVSNYLASLCKDGADKKTVEQWRTNSDFFVKAPVLIAMSAMNYQSIADKLQETNMDDQRVVAINKGRRAAASRIQTIGAVADHLLLALHALGLGAVWMAGPAQAKEAIEKIIGMSQEEDFMTLIPVGYPAEQPVPRPRKSFDELVKFIR